MENYCQLEPRLQSLCGERTGSEQESCGFEFVFSRTYLILMSHFCFVCSRDANTSTLTGHDIWLFGEAKLTVINVLDLQHRAVRMMELSCQAVTTIQSVEGAWRADPRSVFF